MRKGSTWEVHNGAIMAEREKGKTLQEIGDQFGRTKERIRQILVQYYGTSLSPERLGFQTCEMCGHIFKPRERTIKYCSRKCSEAAQRWKRYANLIVRKCEMCGRYFTRQPYEIRKTSPAKFCSRTCLGKYAGVHYGFAAHPENCCTGGVKRPRKYKWNQDLVWREHVETGFGARRLSRLLSIPKSTVSAILLRKRRGSDD